MVTTIGPMVHGAKGKGWIVKASHMAGGTLGGILIGFLAGAAGAGMSHWAPMTSAQRISAVGFPVAVGVLVHDVFGQGRSFGPRRQTPRTWRYVLAPSWAAFLYGVDLGLGLTTRIYFASYCLAVSAAFLAADPVLGLALGAVFGASRAGTAIVLASLQRTQPLIAEVMVGRRNVIKAVNGLAVAQFSAATAAVAAGWLLHS